MDFIELKKIIERYSKLDCSNKSDHQLRVFHQSSNSVSGSLWIESTNSNYTVYTTGKVTQLLYGYIEERLGYCTGKVRNTEAWQGVELATLSTIIDKFNELNFRDSFSQTTRTKLAERAGFICSNPECNKITIGPCHSNIEYSVNVGVAAHIHAASKLGPRYNENQTPEERSSIDNAIWLCGSCSYLIDKNNGAGYSDVWLKNWKQRHESLIVELLESGYNLLSSKRGNLELNKFFDNLMISLEDKRVLYWPFEYEHLQHVAQSLCDLRKELTSARKDLERGSEVDVKIKTMIERCRECLAEIRNDVTPANLHFAIGTLRKAFGCFLYDLKHNYDVVIENDLLTIVPDVPSDDLFQGDDHSEK